MTFSNFFDSLGDLEWLAILAGTVAMYVFGAIWYGPLFGKKWSAGHGVAMGGSTMPEPKVLVAGFVQTLILNIGIAYFITALHVAAQNAATFETLVVSAFMLAFFVVGAVLATAAVYLKKSWSLVGIDFGYYFIGIALAAWVQDLVA